MNPHLAQIVIDHPTHPQAEAAGAQMILEWMGDVSEECWCASWMSGCEVDLLRIAEAGGGAYGQGEIEAEEAALVARLMAIGGWWQWDDQAGVRHIAPGELDRWRKDHLRPDGSRKNDEGEGK